MTEPTEVPCYAYLTIWDLPRSNVILLSWETYTIDYPSFPLPAFSNSSFQPRSFHQHLSKFKSLSIKKQKSSLETPPLVFLPTSLQRLLLMYLSSSGPLNVGVWQGRSFPSFWYYFRFSPQVIFMPAYQHISNTLFWCCYGLVFPEANPRARTCMLSSLF